MDNYKINYFNLIYYEKDYKIIFSFADLKSEIATTAHTFYEWKFPLSLLGVSADYIAEYGIGVMYVDIYGSRSSDY